MKYELLNKCPVCNDPIVITSVSCDKCKTRIEGIRAEYLFNVG